MVIETHNWIEIGRHIEHDMKLQSKNYCYLKVLEYCPDCKQTKEWTYKSPKIGTWTL